MIFLAGFAPFQPTPGLALWSLVIFLLFWWLMSKYAFGPISEALKTRENDIKSSLEQAEKAREELSNLKAENERILTEAREEKALILKQAKESGNKLIADAKEKAKAESTKIIGEAKAEAENQKMAALTEAKNTIGNMAIDIAEKVVQKELKTSKSHLTFVNKLVKEAKLS